MKRFLLALLAAASLVGCPAPEPSAPPKVAPTQGPIEADAHAALETALAQKSSDALIDVFHRYPKLPSGKEALRRAARMMFDDVKLAAAKCDEIAAKGALARIAPFTLDDAEIDEGYDEMQKQIVDNHVQCALVKLDADVKEAEEAWDWPRVFTAIQAARDVDGATLKQRRLAAIARWKTFLEATVRGLASGKITLDDKKKANLLASVDEGQLPGDAVPDLKKWAPAVQAAVLVFHDLDGGKLIEPPRRTWLARTSKARTLDLADGPTFAGGASFVAIARGKLDAATVLVAGDTSKDVVARLASAKLLFDEADTQGGGKKK